jgi:hypothetical protein
MIKFSVLKATVVLVMGAVSQGVLGAVQFVEADGQVVIEAEHYTAKVEGANHPFVLVPDEAMFTAGGTNATFMNARGGRFLQVQPDDGNNKGNDVTLVGTAPYMEYAVKITTVGEYQLYLRAIGWDGSSDSFYAEILSNGNRLPAPNPGWYRYGGLLPWTLPLDFAQVYNNPVVAVSQGWTGYAAPEHVDGTDADVPAVFTIDTPGTYTIRISQREDGSSLDALILQLSSLEPPTNPGPAESAVEGFMILSDPAPVRTAAGATATYRVGVSDATGATYRWEKAAAGSSTFTAIAGATAASYTTGPLQAADFGSRYRVVVTSGGTSLTSRAAELVLEGGTFVEKEGQVVMEAEHFTKRVFDSEGVGFVVVPDEAPFTAAGAADAIFLSARGDRFLQVQPDSDDSKGGDPALVGTAPYVEYAVKIATVGEYQLYLRAMGFSGGSDSVYAEIFSNGQRLAAPNVGWYRYGGILPAQLPMDFALLQNNPVDTTPYGWTGYAAPEHVDGTDSDVPAVFTIDAAGTYTIRISQRESGTSLDALILQLSSMDAPLGGGPASESLVEAGVTLGQPVISFQKVGNQLNITWTNGGNLEEAPSVLGSWNVVATSGSYTTTMTETMRFYRVVR